MELQIVDGLDWIRRKPERFFVGGKVDPIQILGFLMADVLVFGQGACFTAQCGSWWVIASDSDWLAHTEVNLEELFQRIVPAPQHGRNAMRAESLLGAFAADIVVARDENEIVIKGGSPPSSVRDALALFPKAQVAVYFQLS